MSPINGFNLHHCPTQEGNWRDYGDYGGNGKYVLYLYTVEAALVLSYPALSSQHIQRIETVISVQYRSFRRGRECGSATKFSDDQIIPTIPSSKSPPVGKILEALHSPVPDSQARFGCLSMPWCHGMLPAARLLLSTLKYSVSNARCSENLCRVGKHIGLSPEGTATQRICVLDCAACFHAPPMLFMPTFFTSNADFSVATCLAFVMRKTQ